MVVLVVAFVLASCVHLQQKQDSNAKRPKKVMHAVEPIYDNKWSPVTNNPPMEQLPITAPYNHNNIPVPNIYNGNKPSQAWHSVDSSPEVRQAYEVLQRLRNNYVPGIGNPQTQVSMPQQTTAEAMPVAEVATPITTSQTQRPMPQQVIEPTKPILANYNADLLEGADRATHNLHKNDLYKPVDIFSYDVNTMQTSQNKWSPLPSEKAGDNANNIKVTNKLDHGKKPTIIRANMGRSSRNNADVVKSKDFTEKLDLAIDKIMAYQVTDLADNNLKIARGVDFTVSQPESKLEVAVIDDEYTAPSEVRESDYVSVDGEHNFPSTSLDVYEMEVGVGQNQGVQPLATVYFPYDDSNLSSDDREVLEIVFAEYQKTAIIDLNIGIHGYKTADMQQHIVQKRMNKVAAYFVAQGVPAHHINMEVVEEQAFVGNGALAKFHKVELYLGDDQS
jgi:outer membrane protein OmpA-like peptidoglycan-associated protein